MTKPDLTAIVLIIDRSGSMATIVEDAQGGLDTLIKDQAAQPGKVTWTVALFDTAYERPTFMEATTPSPVLQPRGGTALYDAVGRTVTDVGEALAATEEDERPSKVIVVVVTDGLENSSREWTGEGVRKLVTQQTEQWGWEFIYLSAGLDRQVGLRQGGAMGFAAANNVSAARSSYHEGTRVVSDHVANLRSDVESKLPEEVGD